MQRSELVNYINSNSLSDIERYVFSKLLSYAETKTTGRALCIASSFKILKEVRCDLSRLNPDTLNIITAKYGWKNPLATLHFLRKFLKWANCDIDLRLISLSKKELVPVEKILKTFPFHPKFEKEIMKLLESWESRSAKEKVKPGTRSKVLHRLRMFNNYRYYIKPNIHLTSFKDIKEKDVRKFQEFLTNESTAGFLTGVKFQKAYTCSVLRYLMMILKQAYRKRLITKYLFHGIKIDNFNSTLKEGDYLTEDECNRITAIDKPLLEKMNIDAKYRYVFIRFAIKLSFVCGLRASELIRLCIEDIKIDEVSDGLIPIYIYGGKGRSTTHIDVICVRYNEIKDILNIFLSVRAELLKYYNIPDSTTYYDNK